jgi:hypothetical protein
MRTPKQTDPQFKLRLTPELDQAIEEAAAVSGRTKNAEILARLEETFSTDGTVIQQLERQAKMLDYLTQVSQQIAQAFDERAGVPEGQGMLAALTGRLREASETAEDEVADGDKAKLLKARGVPGVPPAKAPAKRKSRNS